MRIRDFASIAILFPSLQEAAVNTSTSSALSTTQSMIVEAVESIEIPHDGISDSNRILGASTRYKLAETINRYSSSLAVNDQGRIISTLKRNEKSNDVKDNNSGDKDIKHTEYPIQIAIAIVEEIVVDDNNNDGDNNVDLEGIAEQFATSLHNKWGIGQEMISSVNNTSMKSRKGGTGVLVFLSIRDRVVFISVGGALDHLLTNGRIDRIIHDVMKEDLKRTNYEFGLTKGINVIVDYLEKDKEPSVLERSLDMWFNKNAILGFVWILFVVGNGAFHQWKRNRDQRIYAKAASKLSEIDRARAELLRGSFTRMKSCPICLEDFSSTTHGSDGHPIQLLRCGHVFNKTCYQEWVSSGNGDVTKCPICRTDVGVSFDVHPSRKSMDRHVAVRSFAADSGSEGDNILNDESGRDINSVAESNFGNNAQMTIVFQSDRNYRLRRLSELYPRYITADAVARWSSPTFNGSIVCGSSFRNRDPVTTQNVHRRCSSACDYKHESPSVTDSEGGCTFGGGTSAGGKGGRF